MFIIKNHSNMFKRELIETPPIAFNFAFKEISLAYTSVARSVACPSGTEVTSVKPFSKE